MSTNPPYVSDRAATHAAYSRVRNHQASRCNCSDCRNFQAARASVFPAAFLDLLTDLGIDPEKEVEIYREGRNPEGNHSYGGWFHFVGSLNQLADVDPINLGGGFTYYMCAPHGPRLKPFEGLSVVQLEFSARCIPWLLDEDEPL